MNFESLVSHIDTVQHALQAQAAHAVNLSLTARNWLIGYYIVEFEQNGEDRAAYGEQLLKKLELRLNTKGLGGCIKFILNCNPQLHNILCLIARFGTHCPPNLLSQFGTHRPPNCKMLIFRLRTGRCRQVNFLINSHILILNLYPKLKIRLNVHFMKWNQ